MTQHPAKLGAMQSITREPDDTPTECDDDPAAKELGEKRGRQAVREGEVRIDDLEGELAPEAGDKANEAEKVQTPSSHFP
jgi:hypothetical protein